jgi:hypothetical protein
VDPKAKKIALLDLTAKDTPSHLAQKQAQADQLQKLLPGWTVEPAKDFYHGKGFSEAQVLADLADQIRRYGGKAPKPSP